MNAQSENVFKGKPVMMTTPDPRNRKQASWLLKFAKGSAGHIIGKHVCNPCEPWSNSLPDRVISELIKTSETTGAGEHHESLVDQFKILILEWATESCKRPQAISYLELSHPAGPDQKQSTTPCCFLLCRSGMIVVVRDTDHHPRIHTAFFRSSTLSVAFEKSKPGSAAELDEESWRRPARDLRNKLTHQDDTGKLCFPESDFRSVNSDEEVECHWESRSGFNFHSKHKWGFLEDQGIWRPLAKMPPWKVAKR